MQWGSLMVVSKYLLTHSMHTFSSQRPQSTILREVLLNGETQIEQSAGTASGGVPVVAAVAVATAEAILLLFESICSFILK